MSTEFPVVDFEAGRVTLKEGEIDKGKLKKAGEAIVQAFRTSGFCHVKNHGIPESFLEEFRKSSRDFFQLPTSFKEKYRRQADKDDYIGWVGVGEEAPNPKRPGDFRECFNALPRISWNNWPEDVVPEFRQHCDEFYNLSVSMAMRILKAIAMALGLPEEDNDLLKCHARTGQPGNVTQIRTLYYLPITEDTKLEEGQVRHGESNVFGSIAILFQDPAGGLEVVNRAGEWVPAPPVPGAAQIYIGEVMQRWSADDFIATKHRVMIPSGPAPLRQSLDLFVHPDDDAVIKCLDGSNKYPPITCGKLMSERMHNIYVESK